MEPEKETDKAWKTRRMAEIVESCLRESDVKEWALARALTAWGVWSLSPSFVMLMPLDTTYDPVL